MNWKQIFKPVERDYEYQYLLNIPSSGNFFLEANLESQWLPTYED